VAHPRRGLIQWGFAMLHPLLNPDSPTPQSSGLLQFLPSCVCTQARLESRAFRAWRPRLGIDNIRIHRKDWEFGFICQALDERGLLKSGKRGLGFAVGREAMPSLFAAMGCEILATDLDPGSAKESGWMDAHQHCGDLEQLNQSGLCDPGIFRQRARFQFADMRNIPLEFQDFDFLWSSCSMEHLGSIAQGERFLYDSLQCLKPGGVAVHTTEYNVSSNEATLDSGGTVLFRRRDLERMAERLRSQGHSIETDFTLGNGKADTFVQKPPYTHDIHLRLQIGDFVANSFGLIVRKSDEG
jgi:SAM-dependent methyltransferase